MQVGGKSADPSMGLKECYAIPGTLQLMYVSTESSVVKRSEQDAAVGHRLEVMDGGILV